MDFNQPITTTPKLLNFLTYFANLQKFMINVMTCGKSDIAYKLNFINKFNVAAF